MLIKRQSFVHPPSTSIMEIYQSIDNLDNVIASIEQQSKPRKQIRATTTWHQQPLTWSNILTWILRQDLGPPEMYEAQSEEVDRGPIPNHPIWRENAFILRWLLPPLAVQWALLRFTGAYCLILVRVNNLIYIRLQNSRKIGRWDSVHGLPGLFHFVCNHRRSPVPTLHAKIRNLERAQAWSRSRPGCSPQETFPGSHYFHPRQEHRCVLLGQRFLPYTITRYLESHQGRGVSDCFGLLYVLSLLFIRTG